ncbi:hypothetical protein [Selenomonas ruminantium]|uniref:hypothetical protein n=1 Tax=Selenomonas ruminantium TaxID=971 RepID=UPI0005A4ED88|nr:hypothetical protein [Selenomonas ruminantium]
MKKLFLLSMLVLSIFLGQAATEPTTTYAADCYAGADEYGNILWIDSNSIEVHCMNLRCRTVMTSSDGRRLDTDYYHFQREKGTNNWYYTNKQFSQWRYVGNDLAAQVILNYVRSRCEQ